MSIEDVSKGLIISKQSDLVKAKIEGEQILMQRIRDAEMMIVHLQRQNKELEETSDDLYALMREPFNVIASKNANFRATYEKELNVMADWMVSQKAFKELAIQFGFEKGLGVEDVIEMSNKIEQNVLEKKNDPMHKTNADAFIDKYRSK